MSFRCDMINEIGWRRCLYIVYNHPKMLRILRKESSPYIFTKFCYPMEVRVQYESGKRVIVSDPLSDFPPVLIRRRYQAKLYVRHSIHRNFIILLGFTTKMVTIAGYIYLMMKAIDNKTNEKCTIICLVGYDDPDNPDYP